MTHTEHRQEQQSRDRPFNPFRIPRSEKARNLVADVINQLQRYEQHHGLRQRTRRAGDQGIFEQAVTAVVCDVTHRCLTQREAWLSIPFSKQVLGRSGRYRSPVMGKTLPDIVERLASPEMAFVELEKGHMANPFANGRRTTIRAGWRLISRIEEHDMRLADFGQDKTQETIILKRTKTDYWDSGGYVEYPDTDAILAYREEMRRINAWLTQADIEFDDGLVPDRVVDVRDRTLRRYFNGSFQEGGRLFGGFWQPMSRKDRQEGIAINGEPTVTLDYGQMAPRILYGMTGATIPEGDAYKVPGFESYRGAVKTLFNSLLHTDKEFVRFPKGARLDFPWNVRVMQVVAAIRRHHQLISHFFCSGIGPTIMFKESEILVDVLFELMDKNIIALPVHDAVIIPESALADTEEIMLRVFKDHTGIEGTVEVDEKVQYGMTSCCP